MCIADKTGRVNQNRVLAGRRLESAAVECRRLAWAGTLVEGGGWKVTFRIVAFNQEDISLGRALPFDGLFSSLFLCCALWGVDRVKRGIRLSLREVLFDAGALFGAGGTSTGATGTRSDRGVSACGRRIWLCGTGSRIAAFFNAESAFLTRDKNVSDFGSRLCRRCFLALSSSLFLFSRVSALVARAMRL